MNAAEVAEDRALAEEQMIDTCRIRRHDANDRIWDEATGQYSGDTGEIVYEGKFRMQVRSDINANAVEAVVAEHEWTYRTATAQLPIAGTAEVAPGCVLEWLTCPLDPSNVGRVYNLQADSKGKTHATHRRFRAKELLS